DTQEVVAAIILGQGTDRLTSITVMKYNDEFAQSAFDSSNVWTDVEEETAREELTAQFCLSANYPNPFNPVTRIQYTVGGSQTHPLPVTLRVYNVLGQVVRTLVNERKERGTYEVIWDGKDESGDEVASGVYFYKLQAEGFSQTKKMVMMK
ncbi:MAG: T9SS type A sorting domain-containing protein, partial [candidate division Zixibacteria bacterium]|nr:T9SS type A sorting domain-containing protein [candidate division Zixibacteria bacterium]